MSTLPLTLGADLRFFAILFLVSLPAFTANFSFTGTFSQDDDLHYFTVVLNSPGDLTIRTYGYGGGVNSAGQTINPGGFDPVISVFLGADPSSTLLGDNNDAGCPTVGQDPVTLACWDSFRAFNALPPGLYSVVISQSDNTALGPTLADGFLRTGAGLISIVVMRRVFHIQ